MLNGMDMETNLHCYSSERLALDHFDLLELLRVHNAREGQTRQAITGVVFLPFNNGKVTLDERRIREHCRQSITQLNFSDSAVGNHKNDYTQITILALRSSDRLPKNSDSDTF